MSKKQKILSKSMEQSRSQQIFYTIKQEQCINEHTKMKLKKKNEGMACSLKFTYKHAFEYSCGVRTRRAPSVVLRCDRQG